MKIALLTALAMVAFAANSLLNRLAVGHGAIGAEAFAVIRLIAGAAALAAILAARSLAGRGTIWPAQGVRATGPLALLVYLFGFSLAYLALDAGTGALILFGTVQVTMFAGAVVSGEAVPPRRWAGAALAFGGLCVLFAPGAVPSLWHAALMAAAGVGWGLYSLAGRGAGDPTGVTAANFILAVPVGLAMALLLGVAPDASAMGVLLAVISGAVTSGLGYALWYAVLPALGAARAAVAQLSVPLIAAGAGFLWLGEPVGWRFAIAAAMVAGGVVLGLARPRP